jgi:hypothetical protein
MQYKSKIEILKDLGGFGFEFREGGFLMLHLLFYSIALLIPHQETLHFSLY